MKNLEEMNFAELCEVFAYQPKGRPLTVEETAQLLSVSPSTLDMNRSSKTGANPPSYRPHGGRRVYYSERDLLIWLYKGRRNSTSDSVAA